MISGERMKITLLVFASILGSFSFIEAQELSLDSLVTRAE